MTPSQPKKIENIIQKEEKDWEKEQKNIKWLNLHHPKQDLISLPANSISSSHISNSLSQPLPFFYFSLYFHNKSKLLKIYIWMENKITLKKHKNKDSFISYIEKIETEVSWSLQLAVLLLLLTLCSPSLIPFILLLLLLLLNYLEVSLFLIL